MIKLLFELLIPFYMYNSTDAVLVWFGFGGSSLSTSLPAHGIMWWSRIGVFTCLSPRTHDVERLFTCLLATYRSSFVNGLLKSFIQL